MICVLIRHGKTPGNEQGKYIGRNTDEELSPQGIKDAKLCKLYNGLHNSNNIRIFTSPMRRATKTANILFGDEYTVIDELTETDFGDFEGMNYEMLNGNPDYQRFIDSGGEIPFPKGESRKDFIERSFRGFKKAISLTRDKETAVIVCHGGTIMAILHSLTGEDYYSFQVKNLEGYRIEFRIENERISDISYNRISGGDNT